METKHVLKPMLAILTTKMRQGLMQWEYDLYKSQYLAKDQLICFQGTVQTYVMMALAVGFF